MRDDISQKKRLDSAYKYLSDVQDHRFKEGQEDRREFQKFYNNLALFSGGTIALSVTVLGISENAWQAVAIAKAIKGKLDGPFCVSFVFPDLCARYYSPTKIFTDAEMSTVSEFSQEV